MNAETVSGTNVETREKIINFVREIGINVQRATLEYPTFLPGLDIQNGGILYDESRMLYPGDMLHEAGHLAVVPASIRPEASSPSNLNGNMDAGGAEMGAIAWTWAAIKHLGIDPEIVFHPQGYKDGSDSIIENFSNGRFFGVSILQWIGLTKEPKPGVEEDEYTFPKMKRWLRE